MTTRKFASALATLFAMLTLAACSNDGLLGPNQGRVRVFLSGNAGVNASANLAGATAAQLLLDRMMCCAMTMTTMMMTTTDRPAGSTRPT